MKNDKFYVYIYKNPLKNNLPFYIGKGSGDRYKHHLYDCVLKTDRSYKTNTIKGILNSGLNPIIYIEFCNSEIDALNREIFLINYYGSYKSGGILTNILKGGDDPPKNKGSDHPLYGTGGTFKIINIETKEEMITNALFCDAKKLGLNPTTLKEVADKIIIKFSKKGKPVIRKQHKGFYCIRIV